MKGRRVLKRKGPVQLCPALRGYRFILLSTIPIRYRGPALPQSAVVAESPPSIGDHSESHRLQRLHPLSCPTNCAKRLHDEPLVVGTWRPQGSPLGPMSPVVKGWPRQPQPFALPPGNGPDLLAVVHSALRSAAHVRFPSSASISLLPGRAAGRGG